MLTIINPASQYPVTLEEAKLHAKVDYDIDDKMIEGFIEAATSHGEQLTNRVFVETEFEWELKYFPRRRENITLPNPPVQGIKFIEFVASSGDVERIDYSQYKLVSDDNRAVIKLNDSYLWPNGQNVVIRFIAGWEADNVPYAIKSWLMLRITELWEQRTNLAAATRRLAIPFPRNFADGLLDKYIIW